MIPCSGQKNPGGRPSPTTVPSCTSSAKQATRIGELALESGYPSSETIEKLYDERDFQRAGQVHAWALPMVGFHALHLAQRDQIGVKDGDVAMYLDLADKKGMLTPNITASGN